MEDGGKAVGLGVGVVWLGGVEKVGVNFRTFWKSRI